MRLSKSERSLIETLETPARKRWISESAQPLIAIDAKPLSSDPLLMEGPKVKVVLITEGLGNRRDMNYYGPEAIDSAPAIFEGAHCFLNHPSYTEERDIPERRVQDMCGYFKNARVEVFEGRRAAVADLHFDLSETGRMGYDKTCTALHYQAEFPGSDKEYVGLSVNANGQSDEQEMNVDGETVNVNYVNQFTEAMSCDIVTLPARGGKFLALVESAAGADMKHKEVRTMLVKRLQAAQSALKEAVKIDDKEQRTKKMAEAQKEIDTLLKAVLESQTRKQETEKDGKEKESDETETDGEASESDESDMEEVPAPGHKIKKTVSTTVHHASDGTDEDEDEEKDKESETAEANRLAVKQLIKESGLDAADFDMKELAKSGLKEAKKYIAQWKRMSESNYRKMMQVVAKVSPSHAAKMNESGKPGDKSGNNNDCFSGCTL